jgi:hypothetical protein
MSMNEWAKKAYYAPQRNEVSEFRNGSEADIAPVQRDVRLGSKADLCTAAINGTLRRGIA